MCVMADKKHRKNFLKEIKFYGKIGCGRPLNNKFDKILPTKKLITIKYKRIKHNNITFINNIKWYYKNWDKNNYILYLNLWFNYLKEINRYEEIGKAFNILLEHTNLCEDVIGVIGEYF